KGKSGPAIGKDGVGRVDTTIQSLFPCFDLLFELLVRDEAAEIAILFCLADHFMKFVQRHRA
ncbi:MAG: hypothetical protein WCK09_18900, partial [Bacteroidota bacterium]